MSIADTCGAPGSSPARRTRQNIPAKHKRRFLLMGALLLVACGEPPLQPPATGDSLVLVGTEAGELLVLAPGRSGPSVTQRIAIPRFREAFALSPDSGTLYFTAFETLPTRALHVFDLRRLQLVDTRPVADLLGTTETQDIVDTGGEAIAVSPDGETLFVAGWRAADGMLGIGMVETRTLQAIGFMGPVQVRGPGGLAVLPAGALYSQGAVLALGRRTAANTPSVYLFLIDSKVREIVDSVAVPLADSLPYQIVPAADGRHVYFNTRFAVVRFDILAGEVRERVEFPTTGWLSIAEDGQELYRADKYVDSYTSGEGRVFVLAPDLTLRDPVDLSAYPSDGAPPVVLSVAATGERLYIVTGTGSFGVAPPYQPGRLFVVRRSDRRIEHVILLDSWNVGPPVVVR